MQIPDKLSYNYLGGDRTDAYPLVNPQTDFLAQQICDSLCATAMMSRTHTKALLTVQLTSTPTLVKYESVWKGSFPTAPVLARIGTGEITLTFPTQITDEQGNTHDVFFDFYQGTFVSGDVGFLQISTSENVCTIKTFDTSGDPSDLSNCVVGVQLL